MRSKLFSLEEIENDSTEEEKLVGDEESLKNNENMKESSENLEDDDVNFYEIYHELDDAKSWTSSDFIKILSKIFVVSLKNPK